MILPPAAHEPSALSWRLAPTGWTPADANPWVTGGTYGPTWSCFRLTDADDDQVRNGLQVNGLYVAAFGRRTPHLPDRLGDFLRYEASHGRTVIVAGLPETAVVAALAADRPPAAVRSYDARWLVHSTPRAAWELIAQCGELRAAAYLAPPAAGKPTLGQALVGDPPDYAEYVALGPLEALGPEFVLACRQAGRMLPDPEAVYEPGVRLYFDAHRIISAGLAVRDGLHTLKVRARLPLAPYLVAALGVPDVPPLAGGESWTTTHFRDCANAVFARRATPDATTATYPPDTRPES